MVKISSHDAKSQRKMAKILPVVLIVGVILYIPFMLSIQVDVSSYSTAFSSLESSREGDVRNRNLVNPPAVRRLRDDVAFQTLQDRVLFLEQKLNSYLSFHSDPFVGYKVSTECHDQRNSQTLACVGKPDCSMDGLELCFDDFPPPPPSPNNTKGHPNQTSCVVYDFGIREQPEFGVFFAGPDYGCDVAAFDPSPITQKWYESNVELQNLPNYRLFPFGAGGVDEDVRLREYDWGQVSLYKYPSTVVDPKHCNEHGQCRYKRFNEQQQFTLPVKTLSTVMKELGHSRVSLLKLDIEGSEYRFLETMITDGSCLLVDQLTLEWHHFDFDLRYGLSSIPIINMLVTLLKERCGLELFWVHSDEGWPSNLKLFHEMGLTLYYNLASFKRVPKQP
jgi:FkbM family methyltransferase